jgi:hypothetical protein
MPQRHGTSPPPPAPREAPSYRREPTYREEPQYRRERAPAPSSRREGLAEAMMKSAGRAIASEVGRRVIRGVLGSILK